MVRAIRRDPIRGRRGIYANNTIDLGPSVALTLDGITVVVISNRVQCADPAFFEAFGLDIAAARVVVVKSRGHFRGGFDEFFRHEQVIEVDAPGLTSPDPLALRLAAPAAPGPADRRQRHLGTRRGMTLDDLPTPCLVLDRTILQRNIAAMAAALARHGVPLRPHMKTAKSIDVARLALAGQPGGITVSTLAEAEYFAAHGIADILYAVGITPQKLDVVVRLNADGADITVLTDDPDMAAAIAAHPHPPRALIEIDSGEARGGLAPDDARLLALAARLGPSLAGVMTHAGHSYAGRTAADMVRIAETERAGVVRAAERLRAAGHPAPIVSMGSSPTALAAARLEGITEVRAGVYMFGDLFQAEIGTHGIDDIAVTVLTSVIGRRPGQLLVDAGGLALSKDRSTEAAPKDWGFGRVLDRQGRPAYGEAMVRRAYQEHGVIVPDPAHPFDLPVGGRVRIAPNHTCMTAAAHDRYYVVDDSGTEIVAVWPRVNGW